MTKNHSLLLISSHFYDISNYLDAVHQSIIDLQSNPPKDEVQKLLKKSFLYLDKNLNSQQAEEIISLIYSCLSQYPDQSNDFYNDLFQNSLKNQYRIIVTAMIFSHFIDFNSCMQYSQFPVFIKISNKEIYLHLYNKKSELIINEQTISHQFKLNFIIDIFSLTKVNQMFTSAVCPYIFAHKSIPKFHLNKIISKIINGDFVEFIPKDVFLDEDFYKNLSDENFINIIKSMNDEIFKQSFPVFEKFIDGEKFFQSLSKELFQRCVKLDINFKPIENLLKYLPEFDLKEKEWNYLFKYEIKIDESLARKIKKFPNVIEMIKILPNVDVIPSDLIKEVFLNKNDLQTYMRAILHDKLNDIGSEIFSKSTFWINLMLSISESDFACPKEFISNLCMYFQKFIPKNNCYDILDEIIFDHFPTSNKENDFLYNFLNCLKLNYVEEFYNNRDIIIVKIIEKSVFPLPSFWKLFKFYRMNEMFENDDLHPIMYYAYEFALSKDSSNCVRKMKIKQLTNEKSENMIIEFIKSNDLDYLKMINEEALSLIISAFLFTNNNNNIPEIIGLTKDTILPFFAISINYTNKCKKQLTNIPQSMKDLFLDACKGLSGNESQLQINSINSIFTNYSFLFDSSNFPIKLTNDMFKIVFNIINNGAYKADKLAYFKAIFDLSCQTQNVINQFDIFKNDSINLFKYIVSSLIKDNDKTNQMNCNLNLQVFKNDELKSIIEDILFNSKSYDDIINLICFLEKKCQHVFKFDFENYEKGVKIFEKAIKDNKWNESFIIEKFFKTNNCKKEFGSRSSYLIYIRQVYSNVFSDPQPEISTLPFEILFKSLMKSKSFSNDYFIILFERISKNQTIQPQEILEKYLNEYEIYGDSFLKALGKVFSYNSSHNFFVRKAEFESITLPISNFGTVLISNMLKKLANNPERFQIFVSLKNIAASFPFIFINDPEKLFNTIAAAFKYSSLFYTATDDDENIEKTKNKLKTAFSALSFLHSILYSVKMLDSFIPWIFENITKFNTSQILTFIYVLISLLESNKIQSIALALANKYNFQKIMSKLLDKHVEKELINYYKEKLYELIKKYYLLLTKTSNSNELIFIDEIQNVKNPFSIAFDKFSTIFPNELSPITFNKPNTKSKIIDEIMSFISAINEPKYFWINYNRPSISITSTQINNFLDDYKKNNSDNLEIDFMPSLPFIESINDLKTKRFLAVQPHWVYQWIVNDITFPQLPEHNLILTKTIKKIKKIQDDSESDDDYDHSDDSYSDANSFDYYLPQLCPKELIDSLINEATSCEDNSNLYELFNQLTEIDTFMLTFFDKLNNYLSHLRNKSDLLDPMRKLSHTLLNIMKFNDYKIRNSFFKLCGNIFLDIALSPKCRNDPKLLTHLIDILNLYNGKSFSLKITHIIGFIFILKDQKMIFHALNLFKKIGNENLKYIFKLCEKSFDSLMKEKNKSYSLICKFFKRIPVLLKKKKSILPSLLDEVIENYKNNNDNQLIDLIFLIFNSLKPSSDLNKSIIPMNEIDFSNTSDTINEELNNGENNYLLKSSPYKNNEIEEPFWKLYEKHLSFLNEILQKDKSKLNKLRFINDYPCLVSFEYRLKNFRKKMKNRINDGGRIYLTVNRSNILQDSFNQLHLKKTKEWLYKFSVTFKNEVAIDAGGVTVEFFTQIVKELFNSNNALFRQTDTKCYLPNHASGVNPEHLQYFRFAGKIMARAIIQEQYVNAHLATTFLRQILHQQIQFADLQNDDEEMYRSFQSILDNDADSLMLSFNADSNDFGDTKSIPLKEKGDEIDVTNENKVEYLKLYMSYKLRKSIIEQTMAFREGFHSLIPLEDINVFSPKELDLIICGNDVIDISDLKRNAEYRYPYTSEHPVIKMFFNVISKWDNKTLSKLLYFFTGSPRVPVNGFISFKDCGKPITFSSGGSKDKFCVGHTCFNRLDIPEYDNENDMNEKLLKSIENCEFGLS